MNGQQNPIIAINRARIANRPQSHETMMRVGPKVCITTPSHPGFLGFEQLPQIGIHPMAGRYLGGKRDVAAENAEDFGGVNGLLHRMRDPQVQRGLRALAVLPTYLEQDDRGH